MNEPKKNDDAAPEDREDAQTISRTAALRDAHALLHRGKSAVLSTISRRISGWPFGSIAPYALDAHGRPILFISTLAEHTKNLDADDRASLLMQEGADDGEVQAHGRITILGRATRVTGPEAELEDLSARYLARVPGAQSYREAHDFFFYRLSIEHVRFIGGFGRIFWLEARDMQLDPAKDPLAEGARGIIEHMNSDHADALKLYCRAFKDVACERAEMVGVDQWGFDVKSASPDMRLRFDFDEPATMQTIRQVMVALVKRAREAVGEARTSAT